LPRRTREKGYVPWTPKPGTIEQRVLADVEDELDAYSAHLPVGRRHPVRQQSEDQADHEEQWRRREHARNLRRRLRT
jgi:hypothetical protein